MRVMSMHGIRVKTERKYSSILGMTKQEYSIWLRDPDVLPHIVRARRDNLDLPTVLRQSIDDMPIAARWLNRVRSNGCYSGLSNKEKFIERYSRDTNLARRVLKKYKLEPPINVRELATRYAKIEVFSLLLNVDGVSLHIKSKGRKPTIILNDNRPPTRKRFTLAHEIGHILIPWHIGDNSRRD